MKLLRVKICSFENLYYVPVKNSPASGGLVKKVNPKLRAMIPIKVAKKNSNFLRPNLSRNRKVNVSTIVIKLPAHRGMTWNGILLPRLIWPNVRKNCSSDWVFFFKFEGEGREFSKKLRSLEQLI